jgi:hypothetical protein
MSTDTEYNTLTGDATVVLRKAQRYEELGRAIARSVLTLGNIAQADGNKSKGVSALKDSAADVARDIGKAQERYSLTAEALLGYAGKLQVAQDDAITAISAITAAEGEVSTAAAKKNAAEAKAELPGEDQAVKQRAADAAGDDFAGAATALAHAHGLWRAARKLKDDAARHAAGQIDDVVNGKVGDQLNDSWWDNLGDIKAGLLKVCEIAAVLSIFLSWVPVLGAVLIGLALLGALVTLVDASIRLSRGEGSLSDVIFAAVGVVLAAFGGKIVSYLAKLAKFKSAGVLAKVRPGKEGFLNRKAFKTVFGASKNASRQELKTLTSFKGAMKEIVQSPFDLKLGTGSTMLDKLRSGAKLNFAEFYQNPLKMKVAEMPFEHMTRGAKVTLGVLDYRQVAGSFQTATNAFVGSDISMKPESVLKDVSNAVESRIR